MTDTAVMDYRKLDERRKFYFACCLVGAFFVGLAYTWSVLQSPFIALLGGDAVKSTVVLCYTVTVLSSTMSPSILGGFIKKLGTRRTIALGSILFGAGYVISGYTTSMAVFFLAFGLGTGVGSGLIYPTIMGYMASLYPDKRGSVSGIIAGVYGGASIFLSPMLAGMIESRSLSFALTVAGGVALVVIFAVAMLIQPVPQGYLEYKCGSGSAGSGRAARSVYDLDRAGMVKTAMFYVAIVAFAFGCTSGMMVISQVSAIMQESFALTATQAAFYVSIMSFMSMSGRFLWGIVTDHFDKYITLCIICGLPVIAMGVLAVSDAMMVAVACLAVTALCYGGFGSTITPITADLFGAAHVTENYGVMYLAFGFAGLAGPQIAVKLSTGGDYSMAFLAACAISAVAFVMALIVRRKVQAVIHS